MFLFLVVPRAAATMIPVTRRTVGAARARRRRLRYSVGLRGAGQEVVHGPIVEGLRAVYERHDDIVADDVEGELVALKVVEEEPTRARR